MGQIHKRICKISSHLRQIFDIINLAREHKISLILPAAFYKYCRYRFTQMVFDGIPRTDPNESPASLCAEDQRACLVGWQRLAAKSDFLDPNKNNTLFKHCRTRTACDQASREVLADLWHPAPKFMALNAWDSDWEDGMCRACVIVAMRSQEDDRGKIWNKLPSTFGLPPWSDLLNDKAWKEQSR